MVDLTARSMSNNVIVYGLKKDEEEENAKEKALDFLRNKLKMEVAEEDIEVAHRMGNKITAKPKLMILRCRHELRKQIFSYTKHL